MKRVRIALRAIAVLVSMLASASPAQTATPAPRVVVGLEPQSYLVERLAGNAVEITVLIEAGRSPHTYEPSPREVAEISRAAVLVTSGMPFEKNLIEKIRALRPDLRVVPSPVQIHDGGAAHTPHDPEHAGCADGDPHFWLDPVLLSKHAEHIARELQALLPAKRTAIESAMRALQAELDALDERVATRLRPLAGRTVVVMHPAYGHLLGRYGLVQLPVEYNGREPGPRQLAALIDRARADGARIVLVQPQHSRRPADELGRSLGIPVQVADPYVRDVQGAIAAIADVVANAYER